MRLLNVRRGQFVYYKNKLHKVYSVQPFLKQSVHLIRLEDYEQQITTAKNIDYYKPRHLDSFIFLQKRYTLDKNVKAKVGDFILVINPKPDLLDHHHLHAMEIVSSIESNGVVSDKSNGIKHNEYWVMVPGLEEGATIIDLQQAPDLADEQVIQQAQTELPETYIPKIGDVYQKNDSNPVIQAMIIAIKGEHVYLGGNLEVKMSTLMNSEKWSYVPNVMDY